MDTPGTVADASASRRRHDLDALRAFAMLLGIVLHAAMAFMPLPWIVQDTQQTLAAGLVVGVIHGFRMPLFFLMSGFFTAMLWQRRGLVAMLRQRFVRVFVPCMLGLVTVLPAGEWVAARSREVVAEQNGAATQPSEWLRLLADAVKRGDRAEVQALLAEENETEGPLPPLVDPGSRTPLLTIAAVLGYVDVARELIDHGAELNAADQAGRRAMHAAAFMGQAEIVELLLKRGADPLPKGPLGDTPLDSTRVDGATTTLLADVMGLPAPNIARVEAGRVRVRQLLSGGLAAGDGVADGTGGQTALPVSAGLSDWRAAYADWFSSDFFVMPFPPRGERKNLFTGRVFDHLWFLWYLCWLVEGFAVVVLVARWWRLPLPPRWLVVSPVALLWLVPLTLVPQLFMGVFRPTFGPDTSLGLLPLPHILAMYAVFFGYGGLLFAVGDPDQRVGRRWWLLLPVAVLVCFPLGVATMTKPTLSALPQVLFAWLMSFGLIGLFRVAIPAENKPLRYLSDSAYWLYLAHIPVLVAIQTWARPWPWPPFVKLLFESVLATAVLLVSYQLFVRHTPIGWLLNGRRLLSPASPLQARQPQPPCSPAE